MEEDGERTYKIVKVEPGSIALESDESSCDRQFCYADVEEVEIYLDEEEKEIKVFTKRITNANISTDVDTWASEEDIGEGWKDIKKEFLEVTSGKDTWEVARLLWDWFRIRTKEMEDDC